MDADTQKRASSRAFHMRRAKQAYGMAMAASTAWVRRLHLKMAMEHERRADDADD